MDPRTAAHTLEQIAAFLELAGTDRFRIRAYRSAARAIRGLTTDDIRPQVRSGELVRLPGIGPATFAVLKELAETGSSSLLERLSEGMPAGMVEMARVPGLGLAKVHAIHQALGIETLQELEDAARSGELARVKGIGQQTAERVARGIAQLRAAGNAVLLPHALAEARRLVASVRSHPDVTRAEIAGSIRRYVEIARDVDIVAECAADPVEVARSFAAGPGVRQATGIGTAAVAITFIDGRRMDLYCAARDEFAVALWRATGSETHVTDVVERLAARGVLLRGDRLIDAGGGLRSTPDEESIYAAAGLSWTPPELREGRGELHAAASGAMPALIELANVTGVLHCHSLWSDGRASIHDMARAARDRGWSYLGVTDHSESAFYAGGLSRDRIAMQHEEIDRVNESLSGVRVLKGIEADILADGRVDYDPEILDRFEFVIGAVHSRFGMDGAAMTARVLRALDDPHLTILAHPTGRLLLAREPYAIDMQAVLEKAADVGAAVELNADPHRLDVDWRTCRMAKELGVLVEIGPDAHSQSGLDNVEFGVGIARKGWLEPGDVLNTRPTEGILDFAARRRAGRTATTREHR